MTNNNALLPEIIGEQPYLDEEFDDVAEVMDLLLHDSAGYHVAHLNQLLGVCYE